MIARSLAEGIVTVRLAHGKASALDLELCFALQREFESYLADRNQGGQPA